ncbi:MAG: hypothetical protein K1563_21265 [Candidatus Thiodiazotropha sp. (ex. Lucinisca nassula)]|uniref:hypothetical protein n=1 Tax=Candidatus Thiodiazotropha sp. LNASS1 TaxID=3096260 RepID=UPI002813CD13|nr:hypothetical protein [Candidatus Thiodiazotropha sp. (ex. Lucinisca nassula)]
MMSSLLEEWRDFCEGREDFDVSHFYTLFHADPSVLSKDQLKEIFFYFPNSEELLSRMANILEVKFLTKGGSGSRSPDVETNDKLISLAVDDLMQKRVICDKQGNAELCAIIDRAKPIYIDDVNKVHELLQADGPNIWLNEIVGDYIESNVPTDKKVIALFEAFYGLTTDYDLVWYVGMPLINCEDISLVNYFNLWKAGGEYVLTEDNLLVTRSTETK